MKLTTYTTQFLVFIGLCSVLTGCKKDKLQINYLNNFLILQETGTLSMMIENKFSHEKDTINLQILTNDTQKNFDSNSSKIGYMNVIKDEFIEEQDFNGATITLKNKSLTTNILLSSEDRWIFHKLNSEMLLFAEESYKKTGQKYISLGKGFSPQYPDIADSFYIRELKNKKLTDVEMHNLK